MLFGNRAVWMLLASLTNALMKIRLPRWFHDRSHRCFLDKPHFTCQFIKYEFFVKSSTYFLTKPKFRYSNDILITQNVGKLSSWFSPTFWRAFFEGTKRLGTLLHDIRPRNVG